MKHIGTVLKSMWNKVFKSQNPADMYFPFKSTIDLDADRDFLKKHLEDSEKK